MTKTKTNKVNIFEYTDYIAFLRDWFALKKSTVKAFSFQYFSDRAGFKSRSFIQGVLKGQKALSRKAIFKVSQALELNKKESEYFEILVSFREAKDLDEKNYYWGKIEKLSRSKYVNLTINQFKFFQHWYIVPIREIVTYFDFRDDYSFLGRQLTPRITAKEAHDAIKILLDLGLIEKSGKLYKQTDANLSTPEDLRSLAIQNFQIETIGLAANSIVKHNKEERDISTITLGTTKEGLREIKDLIKEFHENVVRAVDKHNKSERVYQLNLQIFPLTREQKKRQLMEE